MLQKGRQQWIILSIILICNIIKPNKLTAMDEKDNYKLDSRMCF